MALLNSRGAREAGSSLVIRANQFSLVVFATVHTYIQFASSFLEYATHILHPLNRRSLACGRGLRAGRAARDETLDALVLLAGKVPHLLRDLHRAELWAAHRAEMRGLGAFGWQRLVVVLFGGVGVEGEVELVSPAELEASAGQGVVAHLGGGVAFGEVGSVGG